MTPLKQTLFCSLLSASLVACGDTPPVVVPDAGTPDSGVPADSGVTEPQQTVIRILDFHEFQGQLWGRQWTGLGGAAYLAAHVQRLRAEVEHTLLVSGGDLTGASTLLSRTFHDEPTVAFANLIGLDVLVPGNTDLDRPRAELERLFGGGCHPQAGCAPAEHWMGAEFELISANLYDVNTDELVYAPWTVQEVGGIRVGFIGTSPFDLRRSIRAQNAEGLDTRFPQEGVATHLADLVAAQPDVIIAILHEVGGAGDDPDGCDQPQGTVFEMAAELPDAVDILLVGASSSLFICQFGEHLVTSAGSKGEHITRIDLLFDNETRELLELRAHNEEVSSEGVSPDPETLALLARYQALSPTQRVIGTITETLWDTTREDGENALGYVVADAYLAATATAGAQIAFMNAGGVRAPLLWERFGAETADGQVTLEEAADVLPFENRLVTVTLSGARIAALLEQQWARGFLTSLFPSRGFSYRFVRAGITHVDHMSLSLDGVPLMPAATYRVTMNDFMYGGGVGLTVPAAYGTELTWGVLDLEAMEQYFQNASPISPPRFDRVAAQ